MDYATAKKIADETHPKLLVEDSPGKLRHILVRKTAKQAPHSVMLPESTEAVEMTEVEQREQLIASLQAADRSL